MLKLTPETFTAHIQRKLKHSRLVYSNKERVNLVDIKEGILVAERRGVLYNYSIADGKVQSELLSDVDRRNYANIRVLTFFKSEKEARDSIYSEYVCRWNQVHGSSAEKGLKKDALLCALAAVQNQLNELRRCIETI